MGRRLFAGCTAAMLATAPAVASEPDAAAEVAARFCAARLVYDEAATRALLTPGLVAAIAEAEARNKVLADANPDEKPPLGDGIPYAAYPDAPQTCEPGAAAAEDGRRMVDVRYGFDGGGGWTDRLVTAEAAGGGVLVDDVLYAQFPTDSEQYGLRRALIASFDQWDDSEAE